jgi:uncharacterized membrane protein (UPF0182 family)
MKKKVLIGFGILVLLLLWLVLSIYPDWLWFEKLRFSSVFWTMILSKFGFGLGVWVVFILILALNIYAANRLSPGVAQGTSFRPDGGYLAQLGLSGRTGSIFFMVIILLISVVIASKGSYQWDMFLRYLYQQPFGNTDPIFHRDIGFYVFSLPFHLFVQNGLLILFVLAGLVTMGWYLKEGGLQVVGEITQAEGRPVSMPKITIAPGVKKHLVFLGGVVTLLLAWGYHLKVYKLLYSTYGPAFGASYTDIHVRVLAYRVLIVLSLALAALLFYSTRHPRKKVIWLGVGVWVGAVLVFASLLPAMVQKIVVKPNELAKESPYIAYNIESTRKAYNLNRITVAHFPASGTLSAEDIKKNDLTIQNIRIWDERPLLQTYRQIQAIRLYYDFNNVDVDRYLINGQLRQVTLATRELALDKLPPQANTWVNRHLIYTHGYGLALSPVNEITAEGLPSLMIKDIPPSFDPDLKVERPEIYYGEKNDEYVLVKTNTEEFDYPKGDQNVYTMYQGTGGVPITSFMRRALFALGFLDPQIIFTTYLNPESRIMYNRRIDSRARAIAPFLGYDGDPYLVVSGGKLYWIQDAYTTSNMYPYSRRSYKHLKDKRLNYIRNSVKVTIDAYNGDVCFYMADETDPLVKTYARIFPGLLKPFDEMPAGLKRHIRYPKDLFEIQVDTYRTYHMEDVQVFYNQEDLWQIPDEIYGVDRQEMKPYYVIIKLPGEDKEEFLLMLPFTPSKKDNMIGWLAARNDLPDYGNLLVYKLPKEKLVYGPMQIEARVNQQTEISRELTLWGQRGSRVIRGNLLAIPIEDTFIYVEPVYLEAKQEESETASTTQAQPRGFGRSQPKETALSSGVDRSRAASLPELKRVIVAFGNRLVMEKDLDTAIRAVLGEQVSPATEAASAPMPEILGLYNLGPLALEHYNQAKEYLRQGNWAAYGRELDRLEGILKEMTRVAGEKKE